MKGLAGIEGIEVALRRRYGRVGKERFFAFLASAILVVGGTTSCAMKDAELPAMNKAPVISANLNKELRNFHKVNDYLYRGGMPTPNGIQALHDNGINTIVDLRCDPLGIALEKHVATTLGMEYISLPSGNAPPHPAKVARFIKRVKEMEKAHQAGEKGAVFVHCNAGCDRTSFYLACWRVIEKGWHPVRAGVEMLRYGFLIHHLEFPVTNDADKLIVPGRPYDQNNPQP